MSTSKEMMPAFEKRICCSGSGREACGRCGGSLTGGINVLTYSDSSNYGF